MPPAALPGAFMPAGAPGLLKKFDQNFCLAAARQELFRYGYFVFLANT
jgi:hypothetical protein